MSPATARPQRLSLLLLSLLVAAVGVPSAGAFAPLSRATVRRPVERRPLRNSEPDEAATTAGDQKEGKISLEEKMMTWEATEEEVKAATLGGLVPGKNDAFDVGLYVAFPLMVASGLFFAFFPFIMGNIDVGDVGLPPTS